jgi:hypothetical protein
VKKTSSGLASSVTVLSSFVAGVRKYRGALLIPA